MKLFASSDLNMLQSSTAKRVATAQRVARLFLPRSVEKYPLNVVCEAPSCLLWQASSPNEAGDPCGGGRLYQGEA